jgi:hypothetical protein
MQVVHMYTMMWVMCYGIFEYFLDMVISWDVSKNIPLNITANILICSHSPDPIHIHTFMK